MRRLKQSEVKAYRENMLRKQGGLCAFCGQMCNKPVLDHAHREPYKDKIRGIICNWCNIAIGKLENARIRTGTSWGDFKDSFYEPWCYIFGQDSIVGYKYEDADWHPSKRKREVIEFRKLKSDEQKEILNKMDQDKAKAVNPKNATERIKLFKKLNNRT